MLFRRLILGFASTLLLVAAKPVFAHPLDVAYLDFATASSTVRLSDEPARQLGSGLSLTVAVHPYQAYELVRGQATSRFDLATLKKNSELVSAYVQSHVMVSHDGHECRWDPQPAHTPDTELDAVADGVTIAGVLDCPGAAMVAGAANSTLEVESTLFLEGFPQQTSIVRLEFPDGFADRFTLDRTKRKGTLDFSPLFTVTTSVTTTVPSARRPDAAILDVASRLLDPGMNWFGFFGLLVAAAAIGMLHALGPGHGKSLLAAVLVGQRATVGRAVGLATVMAVTHVSDVFIMAILAGTIAAFLPPTQLLNILELVSAAALAILGLVSFVRAIKRYREVRRHPSEALRDDAQHARMHALGLAHTHSSASVLPSVKSEAPAYPFAMPAVPAPHELVSVSSIAAPSLPLGDDIHTHHDRHQFRQALWTGFLGSLAPCPTAWAMFMATLSVGRMGAGLLLLIAFSLGLYTTVVIIGMLLVLSKAFALRRTPPGLTYVLPVVSSCIVMGLGFILLLRVI